MNKYLKLLIISIIISIFTFAISVENIQVFASAESKAECVIEINSGRVLHSLNADEKLPMASTTKILTALTVIENFNLDKEITVPKNAVGIEGSSIYLRCGEKLTVEELLYGLMLRSGNDCAECLALTLSNSRSEFINLMNKTAQKYGAVNSCFLNPHGLPEDGHYTTAKDLCVISVAAMKNEKFRKIVATKRVEISNDGYDYNRVLINKNKMLFSVDGCTGIKTGYTKKAGRCLVSGVKRGNMEVVAVVLNSSEMWERSSELIDYAFNNYSVYKVFDKNQFNDEIRRTSSGKEYLYHTFNDFYYPLKESEIQNIKYRINGKSVEEFSLKPEKSGVFEIFLQNRLIFSQNIFTIISK